MLKNIISYSLFILLIFSYVSCDDDEGTTNISDVFIIDITSPTGGAMIMGGDTVDIAGTITHEETIHEVLLEATTGDDVLVFTDTLHVHTSNNIDLTGSWVNSVTEHTDMTLTVTASDHSGNVVSEEVSFHCHPM